ncbi:hypothetical protein MNBD_GAMMA26-1510 [hydrothermal vent metagenome]|uniref:Uncharacterized protein n=1 Tax=hydrothermal vent metagenome TaxID=652676 RepID=A0A3B1AWD2_9ZZZZ
MKYNKLKPGLELFAQTYSSDLLAVQPTLDLDDLTQQNRAYAGTGGTSEGNHMHRFTPAYMDAETGQAVVSRFADGRSAPVHLLAGLPEEWIVEHTASSYEPKLKDSIIVGFIRDNIFYTRAEAAKACSH